MRVLVTGGAGYIGSHTCKALLKSGYEPVVIDNLSTGHRQAVKWGPLIKGDLSNYSLLCYTISKYKIETIIHFAASAYVGESMLNPQKYFKNNCINTLNLLQAMLQEGINNIIFSSTCATYGIPNVIPIPEEHLQTPISPYGESKLFIEKMLYWYGKAYGIHSVSLRYFNAAGADPEGDAGEEHFPETHLIPLVIQNALGLRPYIDIYGIDYPTIDGTAIRDYTHVTDIANAHVQALQYLVRNEESTSFNLGTGHGYSVKQIIQTVENIARKPVCVREAPRRPGDPPILVAEPTRAKKILGWKPRYKELKPIIETAWKWYSNNITEKTNSRQ